MTFLELCKMAHRYLGIGDQLPGTAPTTVVGQTGTLSEIVQWVQDGYSKVQREQPFWDFLNQTSTWQLSTAAEITSAATIVASVPLYSRMIPMKDVNGNRYVLANNVFLTTSSWPVYYEDYSVFRGFRDRAPIPTGRPTSYTIQPDGGFHLYPAPDTTYRFNFNYRRTLGTMSVDADVPIIPSDFHEAIVWRAVMLWATQRENPNKFQVAKSEYEALADQLRRDQLPEWTFNETLYYNP